MDPGDDPRSGRPVSQGPHPEFRKARTLSFGHDPGDYAGPDFPRQMFGMQSYFLSRFPETPDKDRILRLIRSFRFALTLWPVPDPDLSLGSDDPRLRYVFAVAKHLDGALFLPCGLHDASGRLLYGEAPADPEAVMPTIHREDPEDAPEGPRSEPSPPAPGRVARRACALAAIAGRALLEQEDPKDSGVEETRRRVVAWADALDLADELEPDEAAFLKLPLGAPARQDVVNSVWRLEGLAVLMWALGRYELPPHDEVVSPGDLFRALGVPEVAAARQFLASASLRPPDELAAQRERQFALHWRLVNWRMHPAAMDFAEFARTAWFGPLDLSGARLVENDLAIGDVPIFGASAELIGAAESTARERHLAANWLNGDGEVYSETDVST